MCSYFSAGKVGVINRIIYRCHLQDPKFLIAYTRVFFIALCLRQWRKAQDHENSYSKTGPPPQQANNLAPRDG